MDFRLSLGFLCLFVPLIENTSGQDPVCPRPALPDNYAVTDGLQRFFNPGTELRLSCKQGFTPRSGPLTIICTSRGEWTPIRFTCLPKRCSYPGDLFHGDIHHTDNVYLSTVTYTCHEGYVLTGAATAVCQANGTWSAASPQCRPVSCGLAPIPQFGMIVYSRMIAGNSTEYGDTGVYYCLPPYVPFGDAQARCTSRGTWTKTPECRAVTCPPPEDIDHGFLSTAGNRDFGYMETVSYGCDEDFVLEGTMRIVCGKDGNWSEQPSCKGPCSVPIRRGRILFKGEKLWIKDLSPNRVLHKEIVSFYCKNEVRDCGYTVPEQCIDGQLKIPQCFQEPGALAYAFNSSGLPSEINEC